MHLVAAQIIDAQAMHLKHRHWMMLNPSLSLYSRIYPYNPILSDPF